MPISACRIREGLAVSGAQAIPDRSRYPAGYKGVIGVTADTQTDKVTRASVHGPHVDVAAPGTQMNVPYFGGDCILAGTLASTSFATAYASATAALLRQRFPRESPAMISLRLIKTASHPKTRNKVSGYGTICPVPALTAKACHLK